MSLQKLEAVYANYYYSLMCIQELMREFLELLTEEQLELLLQTCLEFGAHQGIYQFSEFYMAKYDKPRKLERTPGLIVQDLWSPTSIDSWSSPHFTLSSDAPTESATDLAVKESINKKNTLITQIKAALLQIHEPTSIIECINTYTTSKILYNKATTNFKTGTHSYDSLIALLMTGICKMSPALIIQCLYRLNIITNDYVTICDEFQQRVKKYRSKSLLKNLSDSLSTLIITEQVLLTYDIIKQAIQDAYLGYFSTDLITFLITSTPDASCKALPYKDFPYLLPTEITDAVKDYYKTKTGQLYNKELWILYEDQPTINNYIVLSELTNGDYLRLYKPKSNSPTN